MYLGYVNNYRCFLVDQVTIPDPMTTNWFTAVIPIPAEGYEDVDGVTIYFTESGDEEFSVRNINLQGCWEPGLFTIKYANDLNAV